MYPVYFPYLQKDVTRMSKWIATELATIPSHSHPPTRLLYLLYPLRGHRVCCGYRAAALSLSFAAPVAERTSRSTRHPQEPGATLLELRQISSSERLSSIWICQPRLLHSRPL